jgi:protein-S-isoprenylcysteine O-methyltransferase Ste14
MVHRNWRVFAFHFIRDFRAPREEEMLVKEFGDQYRRYAQVTGRFVPRGWTDWSGFSTK